MPAQNHRDSASYVFPDVYKAFTQSEFTLFYKQRDFPEWHRGRKKYYFWGIDIQGQQIESRISQLTEKFIPYLINNYLRRHHITLFTGGFENRYDEYAEILSRRSINPFVLTIHGPNSFLTCPFIEVEDSSTKLHFLRRLLNAYEPESRTVNYTPHITLGLYADAYPTPVITELMQHGLPFLPLHHTITGLNYYSYATNDIGSMLEIEHTFTF